MKKRVVSFLTCMAIVSSLFGNQFAIYADDNIAIDAAPSEMIESTVLSEDVPSGHDELSDGDAAENTLSESVPVNENLEGEESPVPENNANADGVVGPPEESELPNLDNLQPKPDTPTVLDDGMGMIVEVTEEDMEDVEVIMPLNPETPDESATAKYGSYINFADETDTFFGGEIITIYNGVTISGNMATVPEGSYTLIYLPKDSFEKPSMKDVSLSFEKIKEAEISENETDYIVKTIYKELYGGYNSATPVKVSLRRGQTKNQSRHNIKQEFYTSDDKLKAESELAVNGKAKLENAESTYHSTVRMVSEVNENFVVKENTFIPFGVNYFRFPNSNEVDPRDRRIYATIPEGVRVKENSGWTYDETLKKWYKDVPVQQLNYDTTKIELDFSGINLSENDSKEKARVFQVDFSAQPVENGEPQTDLEPYKWVSRRSYYILKVEVSEAAYMSISTRRQIVYMNKDYGLYQPDSWWNSINTISIPFDKGLLENIRMFFDHQLISYYRINNHKGDEETRKLIITSARTDVPLYSYPSQIRLNIIGNEETVAFMRSKLEGTKAYGIKFDDTKELITDQVPITTTSDLNSSLNDTDWCKFAENEYKAIVFEFPNGGIEMVGENEINKFSSVVHTNVVADLRERLVDDLKTKMDKNEEPKITARNSNPAGYPSYDDFSDVYVKEWFKVTDDATELSETNASARSDTDTYYTLQFESIYRNTNINVTNGKSFFVEDTLTTELSYTHKRNGKASDATQPENLNIYYLVPDGLEPIENKEVFESMEIIRGYQDGYNLVVAKPKNIKIPNLIPNDTSISRAETNRYSIDFKATKRLDIGKYSIFAAMCLDNNQVDIRNGRQYGILQTDTPSGVFSNITKDAKNRPEVSTSFTNFGSVSFTIYPPQSLVALKDVKMAEEADTKYSSSVGNKATIGDRVDYRLRLKNNSTSEIRSLTVIDILPFDGDKSIVENQDGKYTDRGSKFRTPLISVQAQEKFDIYYTTDAVQGTINENKNANWQRQVDDMSAVTMFKAVLKPGQTLGVNEVYDIITHNVIAENQAIDDKEKAFNSFALSLNNEATFIETMRTEVEVNYAKNDVTVEKVDAKDESAKLEGVTFDLYSAHNDRLLASKLTTNRNGVVIIPDLLVGKDYYLKETATAAGYVLSAQNIPFTVSEQAENNKIVIKNTKDVLSIPVEKKWSSEAGGPVKVNLMANGAVKGTVTLTEENEWKHTFTDLPKLDEETKEAIQYTVLEEGTDANGTVKMGENTYQVTISGDMQKGYVITNTKKEKEPEVPKVEKISVSVAKQWEGGTEASVKVNLMANGKVKDTVTLTEANEWKHTFVDLPKLDEETKEAIQYIVFEEGTDENGEVKIGENTYQVAISGNMQTGYHIVNTQKPNKDNGGSHPVRKDDTGHLIVTKNVIGEDQDLQKEFTFTVTLGDKTITGSFGDMIFVNGVATFTLKHGEKKAALHLPKEVSYKVEESGNDGYEVSSTNDVGFIPDEDAITVSFTNKAIKKDDPAVPERHNHRTPKKPEKPDEQTPPTVVTPPSEEAPETVLIPSTGNHEPKNDNPGNVEPSNHVTPSVSNGTGNVSDQPVLKKNYSVLDHVPKTEDTSCINVWAFAAVISFMSLAVIALIGKKKY